MNVNLTKKDIIEKTVSLFETFKPEQEVSFTRLLSLCYSFNPFEGWNSNQLFSLYHAFLRECKKRKIRIKFHEYFGPVGLPYNLGFWRVDKPFVKKVTYNLSYGCWGRCGELNRIYVEFKPAYITYCQIPLEVDSGESNCLIKVSYNPLSTRKLLDSFEEEHSEYDFDDICLIAEKVVKEHKIDNHICDAIASSIIINYDDGTRKVVRNLSFDEEVELAKIYKKFKPTSFSKATENLEELLD